MIYLKRSLLFLVAVVLMSSCSYTVYDMNRGELKIAKKQTYLVNYTTEIPDGIDAKITYTDKDENHTLEHVTGKWVKEVNLASGQNAVLDIHINQPKAPHLKALVTSIAVNGESIENQTQAGRNVKFHLGFKLP